MPRYEYECPKDGTLVEVGHSMSECDTHEEKCPSCNGTMKRLVGGAGGFLLKGDGWTGRDIREKRSRGSHSKVMDKRMNENSGDKKVSRVLST